MNDKQKALQYSIDFDEKKLQEYDSDQLALTKTQVNNLVTRIENYKKTFVNCCGHDEVHGALETGYRTDEYGSGHTTYYTRLYCNVCKRVLLSSQHYNNYKFSWDETTNVMSLKDGCIWYDKREGPYTSSDAKTIKDYGVRRIEKRVVEYV